MDDLLDQAKIYREDAMRELEEAIEASGLDRADIRARDLVGWYDKWYQLVGPIIVGEVLVEGLKNANKP